MLYKIKSKNNLVENDMVTNTANIFFDYNLPVATNDAETTFALLSNGGFEKDNSIMVYPNPASTTVNIKCDSMIKSVTIYDIEGRVLETDLINNNSAAIDITGKTNGLYFLKITSDKGSKVEKLMKK